MSTDNDVSRSLGSWLKEDRHEDADRVLDLVFDQIPATPQHRSWWRGNRQLRDSTRILVGGFVVGAALLISFALLRQLNVGPAPTPIPTATPAPLPAVLGTPVFPGTYRTNFDPPLTITIGSVVDLDCSPGFQCRGNIAANLPSWLDLEFGTAHGSEFMVTGLDKVHDPTSPGSLIDPPSDLASLIASQPGVVVLQGPEAVTVGGIAATQIDIWAHQTLLLGPMPGVAGSDVGFATAHETRVIVVVVDGHTILITEQIGAQNTIRDFQAAVDSLKPLLDSVRWQ